MRCIKDEAPRLASQLLCSAGDLLPSRSVDSLLQTGGEVAVKVVDKSLFRQDPKAEENLRREIRIQKQLVNSEYVVSLYHVEVSVPALK